MTLFDLFKKHDFDLAELKNDMIIKPYAYSKEHLHDEIVDISIMGDRCLIVTSKIKED